MARKPIRQQFFKEATIEVTYTCVEKRKIGKEPIPDPVTVRVPHTKLSAWDSLCDLCGSHGAIEVVVDCPVCKSSHTIDLESW